MSAMFQVLYLPLQVFLSLGLAQDPLLNYKGLLNSLREEVGSAETEAVLCHVPIPMVSSRLPARLCHGIGTCHLPAHTEGGHVGHQFPGVSLQKRHLCENGSSLPHLKEAAETAQAT